MKFFLTVIATLCMATHLPAQSISQQRSAIANEMQQSLEKELLAKWYPLAVDTLYGGFISNFSFDFKPVGEQDKFIVTQARHTWTTAKASELYPGTAYYLQASRHGFHFLRDVMWDKQYGGFYNLVDRKGNVKPGGRAPKDAYGNAFAIYALAAYYHASHDSAALNLARKAFYWMEQHSHDPLYKGYYMHLSVDGTPIKRTSTVTSTSDLGYKDQNSSIHLLEALTELYAVWPDKLVKERLAEMLYLVRDKMTNPKGYLHLFFQADWTPVSFNDSSETVIRTHKNLDHVSFGHNIETAYLMLEATHALGNHHDTLTLMKGKKMLDHALQNGWDNTKGGFYDEGYYFKDKPGMTLLLDTKNWWAQAEGMNTLLLMADYFPKDKMRYFDKFRQQWNYINTYVADHEHGGWYDAGLDKSPDRKTALKGHIWKGAYHDFRAMANCIQRLKQGT
jgi:mannobiose 2-epimerase